jgi:hypothetical protein
MSFRNRFTNVVGAIVTGYAGWEMSMGKFTEEKLWTLPAAIVSFATGSKDKLLERLSKLDKDDKDVAKDIFGQILDHLLKPHGYSVSTVKAEDIPIVIHDIPEAEYRDVPREQTPQERASQYFSKQLAAGRRLPNIPQQTIEGTDVTPFTFAMESMRGDSDNPQSEAW